MSGNNKVIWSDGLFIKPHHFQQQARYMDWLVYQLTSGAEPHNFGLVSFTIDEDMLALGKISLVSASGVMPDGTPFDIPGEDNPPDILDLSGDLTANEIIWLCLPLISDDGLEVHAHSGTGEIGGTRFAASELAVRDNSEHGGELAPISVARAKPVLMVGSQDLSAYARLAVARVIDKTAEGAVILDRVFMPTMLSISAAPSLRRFLGELSDGVVQRAASIAGRIGKPDQNGVAEVSDFLLLQALNTMAPRLRHITRMERMHPRPIYELLLQIVGELSTFLADNRQVPSLPIYDHALPANCWPDLIQTLRQLLSATLVANAVPIPHQRKMHGYVLAPVHERDLILNSEFILAIKARVPQERLHRDFVSQSKVASIEGIRELVQKQLPGIPMRLMPVAPRQLPYHAGYSYFQLDRNTPGWKALENSDGFAFHIAGDFPELELQFWAVKG